MIATVDQVIILSFNLYIKRYICIGLPFFSRDVLMSVYAVDMMQEQGKVLVLGRSVPEEAEEAKNRAIPVPFRAIGWFHNRIVVKDLKATFELTSPSSVKVMMLRLSVANFYTAA